MSLSRISLTASRRWLPIIIMSLAFASAASGAVNTSATAGLALRYDDNVFQYSDRNLARFAPQTLAKYQGLDSTEDMIVIPSFDVRVVRKGAFPTRVSFGLDLYAYQRNSVKNYQAYAVSLRQRIARRTNVSLRYRTIPSFFVGRLADPPNQTVTYALAEFGLSSWRLAVETAVTGALDTEVFAARETKDYQSRFDERDASIQGGGLNATARLTRQLRAKVGIEAERGRAAGADPGFVAAASDGSYRETTVSVRPTLSPTRDIDVSARYAHTRRTFTSLIAADRNYFGRKDQTNALALDLSVKIAKAMSLNAEYDRISRTSNKSGADLEFADYTEQRMSVGAEYRF